MEILEMGILLGFLCGKKQPRPNPLQRVMRPKVKRYELHIFMATLCSRASHYIFILSFLLSFFLSFFLSFPRLFLAVTVLTIGKKTC